MRSYNKELGKQVDKLNKQVKHLKSSVDKKTKEASDAKSAFENEL